jgi:hypothetical protein
MGRSTRPPGCGGASASAASSGDGAAAMFWSAGTACDACGPFVGCSRVACGRPRDVGCGACDACDRCPCESRCSWHTRSSGGPYRVDGPFCREAWREGAIGRAPGRSVQRRREREPRAQRPERPGQPSAPAWSAPSRAGSARPPNVASRLGSKALHALPRGCRSAALAGQPRYAGTRRRGRTRAAGARVRRIGGSSRVGTGLMGTGLPCWIWPVMSDRVAADFRGPL